MTRNTASKNPSRSLIKAKKASSSRNGAQSADANGHPRMPPTANHHMPHDVFKPPRQFIKADAPSRDMYMAKLDGRKAVAEWKLPGVMTVAIRKKRPIREFSVKLTTRNMSTWHRAQIRASTYLTK